jgi:hypothetical protein
MRHTILDGGAYEIHNKRFQGQPIWELSCIVESRSESAISTQYLHVMKVQVQQTQGMQT